MMLPQRQSEALINAIILGLFQVDIKGPLVKRFQKWGLGPGKSGDRLLLLEFHSPSQKAYTVKTIF